MTDITTNTRIAPASRGFGGFFSWFGTKMVELGEANSRVRRAERLNAMNDAELAELGLKREDIARHVFGDLYFL